MINSVLTLLATISVPPMLTLACACACAYLLGNIPKGKVRGDGDKAPPLRDDDASKRLAGKLVSELEVFRSELLAQQQNIAQLNHVIDRLRHCSQQESISIAEDAQETMRLVTLSIGELPEVFASIQQTTKSAVQSLEQLAKD